MLGSDIATPVRQILQDPSAKHWTAPDMLQYIHRAQLELVAHVPRAAAGNVLLDLAADQCEQTLAATYMGLLDISLNRGDGTEYGGAITRTTLDRMQASRPTWRQDRAAAVRQYMQDERDARTFFVWPGPSDTIKVEARAVVLPVLTTDLATALVVSNDWKNAIIEAVLAQAFSKDGNDTYNLARASMHYGTFATFAGIKTQSRSRSGPGGNSTTNPAYPAVEKNGA
jgi:hypothetical protein